MLELQELFCSILASVSGKWRKVPVWTVNIGPLSGNPTYQRSQLSGGKFMKMYRNF